jgi:AcrR family transcriptional regulator
VSTASSARPRARLSRDRVLRAAVRLADRDGIEALSMRRLGRELGVEAMSLYHHVAGKEDLLDGIVDLVWREVEPPGSGSDWKAAMRARAASVRAALARHPWAAGVLEARNRPSPAMLRHHESVLRCLREAGFSLALAAHAFAVLDSYVYGFALQERVLPFDTTEEMAALAERMVGQMPPGEFPLLGEMAARAIAGDYDWATEEYEFGLELILDGLERVMRSRGHA